MNGEKYYVQRCSPGWAIYSRTSPACPVRLYGLTERDEVVRICEEMNLQEHRVTPEVCPPSHLSVTETRI